MSNSLLNNHLFCISGCFVAIARAASTIFCCGISTAWNCNCTHTLQNSHILGQSKDIYIDREGVRNNEEETRERVKHMKAGDKNTYISIHIYIWTSV